MTPKEIPILFSTPMVQAILEDRKTMTRRTRGLKQINEWPYRYVFDTIYYDGNDMYARFYDTTGAQTGGIDTYCPYGKPGDLLWVRESSATTLSSGPSCEVKRWYKADEQEIPDRVSFKWKPSIHMPKAAARIWLEVTDIRVERLHDISKADAIAEGILSDEIGFKDYDKKRAKGYGHPDYDYPHVQDARLSFLSLWESINGFESRNSNPWVWVVSFKVLSTPGKPKL